MHEHTVHEHVMYRALTEIRVQRTQERIVKYYITIPRKPLEALEMLGIGDVVGKPMLMTIKYREDGTLIIHIEGKIKEGGSNAEGRAQDT